MPIDSPALANAPPQRRIGFRDLIDPVSPESFLDRSFGKEAVYLPGPESRFADVFSWQGVSDLLNMTSLWSATTLKVVLDGRNVRPEEYCTSQQNRDGGAIAQPDPARVQALIRQGATISLNLVETMTPEIAAIAAGLQCWFDGETVCNIYCSWGGHQGFQSHFDVHDVFVLQIDGTKSWNIYDGTFEETVNLDGYRSNSFSDEHNAKARGNVETRLTMTPGDVLYIPRGRYHDALASSEASLHLTFGIDFMSGFHFLSGIADALLQDPFFRKPLPRFDQTDAHRDHMRKLAEHVREYTLKPELSRGIRAHQRQRAFAYCFPAYDLPTAAPSAVLRVRALNKRLVRRGADWRLEQPDGETTLSADEAQLADWLLTQDFIVAGEAESKFGSELPVEKTLKRLQSIGLLDEI
jgi:ribosomal protein L16 Arg81 hydroxylase